MVGAAPLSPELTLQFQKVLPQSEIGQGYGMTETCTTVTMVCLIGPPWYVYVCMGGLNEWLVLRALLLFRRRYRSA